MSTTITPDDWAQLRALNPTLADKFEAAFGDVKYVLEMLRRWNRLEEYARSCLTCSRCLLLTGGQ